MNLKRAALVPVLISFGFGCDPGIDPTHAAADLAGQVTRDTMDRLVDNGDVQLKAAGATSLATAAADVVLLESAGKLPSVAKLTVGASSIRAASAGAATDGIAAVALAANVNDLIRSGAANPFKKLSLTVGGNKGSGKYDKALFGALACASATSAKNIKATLRLSGTTQQAAGAGAVFAVLRVPLATLGLTPGQWVELCESAPDLLDGIVRIAEAQSGLRLSR